MLRLKLAPSRLGRTRSRVLIRLRSRTTAIATSFVLLAGGAVVPTLAGSGSAGAPAAAAPTKSRAQTTSSADARQAASQQAVRTKQPVVVDAMTTATEITTAEPDGTFQLKESALPVRVLVGGAWKPIDTTLVDSGNAVTTRATTLPLTLGGKGSTTLAKLSVQGASLALTWPKPLPAPRLSGSTATYAGVFPGVDLRVTASDAGFSEQLVLHSRSAAADPALRAIVLGVRTQNASLREGADGSLGLYRATGTELLESDPALMWDAQGANGENPSPAHTSKVSTTLGPTSITLSPDPAFLSAPSTAYPVTIDPAFDGTQTVWTKVFSGIPTQNYLNGGQDGSEVKVGDCFQGNPDECNGIGVARSYFQYDVSGLHDNGGLVKSAWFNVSETFGAACDDENIDLELTGGISSSTTWDDQPSPSRSLGQIAMNCKPADYGYNIWALWNGGTVSQSVITVMLRADNESDQNAWRKFSDNPTLTFTYNRVPGTPAALTTAGKACSTTPGAQVINPTTQANGTKTIAIGATDVDPDGDDVRLDFTYTIGGASTSLQTPYFGSGGSDSAPIPASALVDGAVVSWHVHADDSQDSGPESATCYVTIDETAPDSAPSIASASYPGAGGTNCTGTFNGGIGQTGSFTFGPSASGTGDSSTTDIASYTYSINGAAGLTVPTSTPGGSATAPVTPTVFGPNELTVFSADRAGNQSRSAAYCFNVRTAQPATHYWPLDGRTGNASAPDEAGPGVTPLPATMTGLGSGGGWTAGRVGSGAALFNGSLSDYIQAAPGAAVDTGSSFAVSAWVRLDAPVNNNFPTAVSIDSKAAPGFQLQAESDGHWAFVMTGSDTNGGGLDYRLPSSATVVVGQWTQLVGSYDAGTQTMSIYVDGKLSGTLSHDSTWSATGPLTIGRSMFDGTASDPWDGAIDDVRVFDHALEPTPSSNSDNDLTDVHNLVTLPLQQKAWYDFEQQDGTTTEDATGNWNPAALTGGATIVNPNDNPDHLGSGAVRLDGSTGYVATAAPVIQTTGSFTISAWVDIPTLSTGTMTFVSQDGTQASNIALQYRNSGTPTFAVQLAGSDTAGATETVVTGGSVAANTWTNVSASYDAVSGLLRLFVGGTQVGQSPGTVGDTWAATGPFEMGRALVAGTGGQYFAGEIDNVRVFSGAQPEFGTGSGAAPAPAPSPQTPYTGELTRWVSLSTPAHISSATGEVPPGFVLEGPLGAFAPPGASDTGELYACLFKGVDEFSSRDPACEGQTVLGPLGPVYLNVNDSPNAVTLYRCTVSSGYHFDSISSTCEGQTVNGIIGYLRPLANIARYQNLSGAYWDSANSTGLPPDMVWQNTGAAGEQAEVSTTQVAGAVPLTMCTAATGEYLSTDSTCGGGTVDGSTGFIWTAQPGANAAPLYSCVADSNGQSFVSLDPGCESLSSQNPARLGWVETS